MKCRFKYPLKTIRTISLGLLFLVPSTPAQVPVSAGYSPVFNIGAGYSYANVEVPSLGHLGMNGVGVTGDLDFNSHFGIEADVNYVRSFNAFSTGHSASLLGYMGGPVFFLKRTRRVAVYAHVLLGATRETGVNISENGPLLTGFVSSFAWTAGGGAQYSLDRNLSLRFGADYLSTKFFDPTTAIKHQNDIQAFVGLSYRFGGRRR